MEELLVVKKNFPHRSECDIYELCEDCSIYNKPECPYYLTTEEAQNLKAEMQKNRTASQICTIFNFLYEKLNSDSITISINSNRLHFKVDTLGEFDLIIDRETLNLINNKGELK